MSSSRLLPLAEKKNSSGLAAASPSLPPALCLLCRPEVEEERKKLRMKKKGVARGGRRGRS
jgi:hypothetical protein